MPKYIVASGYSGTGWAWKYALSDLFLRAQKQQQQPWHINVDTSVSATKPKWMDYAKASKTSSGGVPEALHSDHPLAAMQT